MCFMYKGQGGSKNIAILKANVQSIYETVYREKNY
jgi:hypothetical protein